MSVQDQLQTGEEVLYQAHPSRLPLVPPLAAAALVTAAGLWVWTTYENLVVTLLAGTVAVVFLAWAGVRYLVIASHEYVLTNRRIIRQQGILSKASNDAYLDKINNVEHRQSLWGRLLGFGDVVVDTASETGTTVFAGIADPLDFKRAIVQAAGAARGAHGPARGAVAAGPSGAERLRQLKSLLDEGLISAEEYEAKRRQLLTEL
jgi:membrane protein YdbS with pleckstrin-like domain